MSNSQCISHRHINRRPPYRQYDIKKLSIVLISSFLFLPTAPFLFNFILANANYPEPIYSQLAANAPPGALVYKVSVYEFINKIMTKMNDKNKGKLFDIVVFHGETILVTPKNGNNQVMQFSFAEASQQPEFCASVVKKSNKYKVTASCGNSSLACICFDGIMPLKTDFLFKQEIFLRQNNGDTSLMLKALGVVHMSYVSLDLRFKSLDSRNSKTHTVQDLSLKISDLTKDTNYILTKDIASWKCYTRNTMEFHPGKGIGFALSRTDEVNMKTLTNNTQLGTPMATSFCSMQDKKCRENSHLVLTLDDSAFTQPKPFMLCLSQGGCINFGQK